MNTRDCKADDAQVFALDAAEATDVARVGAKAAALARAGGAGLPVLPGFVITPAAALSFVAGEDASVGADIREAWAALSGHGERALIVRSSSRHEDNESSSMAGRFDSVLDVSGWEDFAGAVRAVVASGAAAVEAGIIPTACMAVLVQPFIEPDVGGVLFGADPVSGRTDRVVVAATEGNPDALVSGAVAGVHLTLRGSGRVVSAESSALELVPRTLRRTLARLAKRVRAHFDSAQDIQWAALGDRVILLQTRPITATSLRGVGPVLGPGPVAETFPDPLSALERDLWLEPMRDAIREVLVISGAASRRAVDRSPVVTTVGGRAAVDLELLGMERPRGMRAVYRALDPRGPMLRLGAAWRTGRLRGALPGLARDVISHVDRRLAAVPDVGQMEVLELVEVMHRVRRALTSVYAYEMLAVRLLGGSSDSVTSASVALRVLVEHGGEANDSELMSRYPVLLSLQPPRIGSSSPLPRPATAPVPGGSQHNGDEDLREALRLRARWLHELSARAALAVGERLAQEHRIANPIAVRELGLGRLTELARGEVALDLGGDRADFGVPLPPRFQLSEAGDVVALVERAGASVGAGGGRAIGTVVHAANLGADLMVARERSDVILVVSNLDPSLATLLPSVRGLVAETGSPLSHLAILAREAGVATAVGVEGATSRFAPGETVLVDGTTGEVLSYGEAVSTASSSPIESSDEVRK